MPCLQGLGGGSRYTAPPPNDLLSGEGPSCSSGIPYQETASPWCSSISSPQAARTDCRGLRPSLPRSSPTQQRSAEQATAPVKIVQNSIRSRCLRYAHLEAECRVPESPIALHLPCRFHKWHKQVQRAKYGARHQYTRYTSTTSPFCCSSWDP